ncbi:MAG: hydroxyacid dehydrogenase [Victivallales bacterium]|nr:hydroxyacid dehydrogenase [Victivallales bacterium]
MKTVLITGDEHSVPAQYLSQIRDAGIELTCQKCHSPAEVEAFCQGANLIWLFGANPGLTGEMLKRLPCCKGIFRSGSGLDTLPTAEAEKLGIEVLNTPESIAESVAEHAVAMLFALIRRIPQNDRAVRNGKWGGSKEMNWHISGRTLGVVGYGRIGRNVERMVSGFRMTVLHHDPFQPDSMELNELLKQSDYVSLHCPLTPETRGLIDARRLALMKPHALLVNTSRGPVVDEEALVAALKKHEIGGAALDVLCEEPPPKDHPLFGLENVILSPHIAAFSADFEKNFWSCSARKIIDTARRWEKKA